MYCKTLSIENVLNREKQCSTFEYDNELITIILVVCKKSTLIHYNFIQFLI